MSKFIIEGGVPIAGRHYSPGNKNAALPMIAASLLADSPVEIANLPLIRDVSVMLELVAELGASVSFDRVARKVTIDPRTLRKTSLSEDLCNRIRTSILFAGPLVAKTGAVVLPPPGGDVIGRRRLDTHFEGLRNLGVLVDPTRAPYVFSAPAGLRGAKMILDEASVTATENIVMAATLAKGRTEIFNAACEPHVQDLCRMLRSMGASISGIGTNLLVVDGVDALHGASVRVSPDAIESASFIAAAAATHGSIVIDETLEHDFEILKRPFARLGVTWTRDAAGALTFDSRGVELRIAPEMSGAIAKIEDGIWPQTPTDLLSVLLVLATQADGIVLFFEKMFESRMYFVDSLINMGAQIVQCDPHRVVVRGVSRLRGAKILSPDIRAGMALLVAGLCAEGVTTIANAESIDRGYEPVERALSELGPRITRVPGEHAPRPATSIPAPSGSPMPTYSPQPSFSRAPDPDGILLVDKPSGMTSHDVVNAVRKMFKIEKAGHGGTLDPSATGLLVLLLGKATKLSERVMGGDKVYEGVMRLGSSTTTQDAEGERVSGSDPSGVTEEALRAAIATLTGDIYQTPPMVSALKKDGVPLYKLARKGEVVERQPRLVHIYRFQVVEFGIPDSRIEIKCTKGTYVRTLCHDVGEKLGCGGHLASLRRTQSGKFTVDKAIRFEDLKTLPRADLARHVLPMLAAME